MEHIKISDLPNQGFECTKIRLFLHFYKKERLIDVSPNDSAKQSRPLTE